jgi:4-amino-4-deoxy-L-arabinose transferase-like glycosyltransferase
MKLDPIITLAIIAIVLSLLLIAAFGGLIGYMITIADSIALIGLVISLILASAEIKEVLSKYVNKYSLIALIFILIFFIAFSIFFLPKTELIFFDENIYQGVALNIMHSGSALQCEYGSAYVQKCFNSLLGFDPGGWPLLLAVAFRSFGISNNTSYNVELLMGVLSIVSVFLISSILTAKKEIGVISAAIFALIPQIFIWSKTLANPDMPFLAFASLTILFFLIFMKKQNKKTLLVTMFCLVFTIYIRVQALLLVPLLIIAFLTLSDAGIISTFKSRMKLLFKKLSTERNLLLIFAVFLILIGPQLYTMVATTSELQANAAFYIYPSTQIFSSSYILPNLSANVSFLSGILNDYPIIFIANITIFALIGVAFLLLQKKEKNRFGMLLFLAALFLLFFIFFLFYFSGSVLVGVSVRYLLILYPTLSILSAFGVLGLGDWLSKLIKKSKRDSNNHIKYIIYAVLITLVFVIPFAYAIPILIKPTYNYYGFPLNNVTSNIQGLNPYTTQYAKNAADFVQNNYQLVPPNCLVLSGVTSMWFMLNRSSSYLPQTDIFTNPNFDKYSCFYLDYGFWCTVSPYNTSICNYYMTNYSMKLVATKNSGGKTNFSLYQILNYTPK